MKFECCKKFPRGARVEVIDEVPLVSRFSKDWSPKNCLKVGSEGTIVDNDNEDDEWIGVKWDEPNEKMHDCGGGWRLQGRAWMVCQTRENTNYKNIKKYERRKIDEV